MCGGTAADVEVPWMCSSRCLWFSLKLEADQLQRARQTEREWLRLRLRRLEE